MRIIARKTLKDFWQKPGRQDAEGPLKAWFFEVNSASWRSTADIKKVYPTASIVSADRVVFNIGGNKYRLIVAVHFKAQIVFIRFVGTHKEYDKVNAKEV